MSQEWEVEGKTRHSERSGGGKARGIAGGQGQEQ